MFIGGGKPPVRIGTFFSVVVSFTCVAKLPCFFASGFHQALAFAPIVSGELRAYIAHARSFQPHVPVELSNYIASAYAEMRQDEN